MSAVSEGRVDLARLLLDAGANNEAKDKVRCRSAESEVGRVCIFEGSQMSDQCFHVQSGICFSFLQ